MKMFVPSTVQSRRAALLAHAMGSADRAWLLASLPPPHRHAMQGWLDELRELGIPPDATLLHDAIAAPVTTEPEEPRERLAKLDARQLQALAHVLKDEPAGLTARLLALRPWPWKDALVALLPAGRVQSAESVPAWQAVPALEQALCDVLLRRLEMATPARGGDSLAKWRKLLVHFFLRWGTR